MEEKIYKAMKRVGGFSIALGIISIVVGVTVGVLSIVNGAELLKKKLDIIF